MYHGVMNKPSKLPRLQREPAPWTMTNWFYAAAAVLVVIDACLYFAGPLSW